MKKDRLRFEIPDDVEIDIEFVKKLVREAIKTRNNGVVQLNVGMGVLASRDAKNYLCKIESKFKDVDLIIQTDSLPTRLQANFIKKTCLKNSKVAVVRSEEVKICLN